MIVTGESIQLKCDFFLGTLSSFSKNPKIWAEKEKHIDIDTCKTLAGVTLSSIFCYTHLLSTHFKKIYDLLSSIEHDFILVCHNSDGPFIEKYEQLLNIVHLKKIYTQNLNWSSPKAIQAIPIGIANSQWPHGNLDTLRAVMALEIKKENEIYFWVNVHTNPEMRSDCITKLSSFISMNRSRLPFEKYLKLLASHKFAICPVGNGLDTHRFWEAIYLKVVPICIRMPFLEYFSQYVPVVLLDKWEDLSNIQLDYDHFQQGATDVVSRETIPPLNPLHQQGETIPPLNPLHQRQQGATDVVNRELFPLHQQIEKLLPNFST